MERKAPEMFKPRFCVHGIHSSDANGVMNANGFSNEELLVLFSEVEMSGNLVRKERGCSILEATDTPLRSTWSRKNA